MQTQNTSTGPDTQLLSLFADILELAASEPGSLDEANETLYAIEDAARAGTCYHQRAEVVRFKLLCPDCGADLDDGD